MKEKRDLKSENDPISLQSDGKLGIIELIQERKSELKRKHQFRIYLSIMIVMMD